MFSAYAYMHMFNVLDDDVGLRAVSPSVCGPECRVAASARGWRGTAIYTRQGRAQARDADASRFCKYREVEAEA